MGYNSNFEKMDEQIFLARVAEQAERFEDMVNFLKAAIAQKGGEDFTVDERNLLSVGFKNLIGSQRGAIRTIGAIEQNPKYSKFSGSLQGYKTKMVGDYYRYVAESAKDETKEKVKNGALEGYTAAKQHSQTLNACNPIRLGLALNFSVFYYEVLNDHKKACELGEKALADALEKIDEVDEETFRDAKSIIELLKENLSLWKEEEDQNAVDDL